MDSIQNKEVVAYDLNLFTTCIVNFQLIGDS